MYQRLRILCLEPPSSLNRDPTFVQVGDNDVITPNSVLYARDAMDRFHADSPVKRRSPSRRSSMSEGNPLLKGSEQRRASCPPPTPVNSTLDPALTIADGEATTLDNTPIQTATTRDAAADALGHLAPRSPSTEPPADVSLQANRMSTNYRKNSGLDWVLPTLCVLLGICLSQMLTSGFFISGKIRV